MLFETHAHLDDPRFDGDRDAVIQKIKDAGVTRLINVGADMKSSKASVELAQKHDFIYAAVGVHPHDTEHMTDGDLAQIAQWCSHKKVIAIGEIGLDYHYDNSPRDAQKYWFKKQLHLAEQLDIPVIIHEREAIEDCLEILSHSKARGVVHCFGGAPEVADRILKLGYVVAFGGVLTFKNARKAVQSAQHIGIENILLETDCPYLAPEGHRGERNDSSYIGIVCRKVADLKGLTYEQVAQATYRNAERVFRLDNQL